MQRHRHGYQNVRIKYDGREIRTIAVDPERAPYIKMAFELYATGQYRFPELRDALTDAGLRTKGNRRYGPRPISILILTVATLPDQLIRQVDDDSLYDNGPRSVTLIKIRIRKANIVSRARHITQRI